MIDLFAFFPLSRLRRQLPQRGSQGADDSASPRGSLHIRNRGIRIAASLRSSQWHRKEKSRFRGRGPPRTAAPTGGSLGIIPFPCGRARGPCPTGFLVFRRAAFCIIPPGNDRLYWKLTSTARPGNPLIYILVGRGPCAPPIIHPQMRQSTRQGRSPAWCLVSSGQESSSWPVHSW